MKAKFITNSVTIKRVKDLLSIDFTTNEDNYRNFINRKSKAEIVRVAIELRSRGKTKKITDAEIIEHYCNQEIKG